MTRTENDLATRLRQLREREGLSQRELAEAIGVDQSAVHRMETGERRIEVGELVAACERLGVSVQAVLEPKASAMALRASAPKEQLRAAEREFRRVIDDFFAFQAAAQR